MGIRGLAPKKNSHGNALYIVGKRPILENLSLKKSHIFQKHTFPGFDLEFGEGTTKETWGSEGVVPVNFLRPHPLDSQKMWETPLLLHLGSFSSSLNLHSS